MQKALFGSDFNQKLKKKKLDYNCHIPFWWNHELKNFKSSEDWSKLRLYIYIKIYHNDPACSCIWSRAKQRDVAT